MASTNKTTNYELSQYIGTDKPTYLTDYNQDMSKIDAGIHAAKSEADTNANAIGDLSSLTTTAKTSLVAAANEIDADVATNTNNIATNTSNIATNTTHIGTLANLTTTSKTDLVVAANEINAKVGNTANLETTTKTSLVAAINELVEYHNLGAATQYNNGSSDVTLTNCTSHGGYLFVSKSTDGDIFKVYGKLYMIPNSSAGGTITLKNTGVTTDTEYTINDVGIASGRDDGLVSKSSINLTVKTNGDIVIDIPGDNKIMAIRLFPCLYFNKNLGDIPE